MATPIASAQASRQFYWGLSLGIIVLALVGFVWFGWAISVFESPAAGAVCGSLDAILTGCLIWAGRRVRRQAGGFKRSDLRLGCEEQRIANRRTSSRFRWVVMGEWSGIGLAAFATYHFGRGDLFPPAMSLVIALHFFPLASLFRVPVYRATASAGSTICITALLLPATLLGPDSRLVLNGVGFGAVMWATAAYCALYPARLAAVSRNDIV
jgi:hypothetical protein